MEKFRELFRLAICYTKKHSPDSLAGEIQK